MRTNLQKMESPRFLYGKVHRNLRYGLADFCREKKLTPYIGPSFARLPNYDKMDLLYKYCNFY
jgi:hypothetical protein